MLNIILSVNLNFNYIVCLFLSISTGIGGARESEKSSTSDEIILIEC